MSVSDLPCPGLHDPVRSQFRPVEFVFKDKFSFPLSQLFRFPDADIIDQHKSAMGIENQPAGSLVFGDIDGIFFHLPFRHRFIPSEVAGQLFSVDDFIVFIPAEQEHP